MQWWLFAGHGNTQLNYYYFGRSYDWHSPEHRQRRRLNRTPVANSWFVPAK